MAIRILSDQNVTSNVIAIQAFRLGTDSLWKLRGNAASTELAFEYSTSATLNDNNIKVVFKPSGDVGIGTNSPAKKLDVEGNIRTINTGGTVAAEIDVTSGSTWRLRSNPTSGTNNYGLDIIKGGAGTDVKMSIDSSGNVGIGTIEPDGKVHIFNGSNGATTVGTASDELILENDTDCGLTIRSAADATGVVSFASPTDHNVGQLYYNHDDDSMVIKTNDAIRTIIGSSGIMYIMGATASTNNSLQLQYNSTAGTAEIYSKSTGGNTTFEFYTSNSGTTTQKFNIGSSGDVKITTNGKFLQGVRNTNGNVIDMIGFGAGTDRLQIKGGASGGSESIAFFDTAGQMATFYDSNFGIGTTSPAEKLEVSGSVKVGNMKFQNSSGGRIGFNRNTANGVIYDSNYAAFQINGAYSGADYLEIQNYNSSGVFLGSLVLKDGNVGIGTTLPTNGKFVINQNSSAASFGGNVCQLFENFNTTDGQMMSIGFRNNNSVGTTAYIDAVAYDQSIGATDIRFSTYSGSAWSSNMVTFQHTGRVGIGTTSPQHLLHLKSTISGPTGIIIENTNNAQSLDIDFWNNAGAAQGRIRYNEGAGSFDFFPNVGVTSALTMEYGGNVGIGVNASDYWANANNLVVGGLGAVSGITIATDGNLTGSLIFADGTGGGDNTRGGLQYDHSANDMLFRVNNATRMTINDAGNVFISTPITNAFYGLSLTYNNINTADFTVNQATGQIKIGGVATGYFPTFYAGGTERMRITSGGLLFVGDTTTNYGYSAHHIANDASQGYALIVRNKNTTTTNNSVIQLNQATSGSDGYFMICRQGDPNSGTNRLFIYSNGNVQNVNNSYGAISDERLKENIVDATPKLDDLMKVKIRNYNFIGQEDKQIGVIAQEIENVFPNLVEDTKDPENEETTKSVKYSVLVPILVKSIQELKAEIELLKNK